MKEDARYQPLERLAERREEVIRWYREGMRVMAIVAETGLSYPSVRKAIDLYEQGGMQALQPAFRGRAMGQQRRLTPQQESALRHMLLRASPMERMKVPLWSRATVNRLIEEESGLRMPRRTRDDYLGRWGLIAVHPMDHDRPPWRSALLRQWLHERYAPMEERARSVGGEIHWGDESEVFGEGPSQERGVMMLSTIHRRAEHWIVSSAAEQTDRFMTLCNALVLHSRAQGKKVFLIVDERRVKVRAPAEWLAAHQDHLEVHGIPDPKK